MRPRRPARRRAAPALAALAVLGAAPAIALAATSRGVTPTSPKPGAIVTRGKPVTFKGTVTGGGPVFVHVCRSKKRSKKEGVICSDEAIGKAVRRSGRFHYTQKPFGYDEYWLNRPGTYSWQAYRIACEGGVTADCRQEGPVITFRVR